MTYAEYAAAYRQQGFAPIPVKGKRPVPSGATGTNGVVTDEKIAAWCADAEWAASNLALRVEGFVVLDVDHYDEKEGATQLAELEQKLGSLPATITSTSRGQDSLSRQHFYLVPEDRHFVTKAADDIDVLQRRHRYAVTFPSVHPETGETYRFYSYDGEPLDDLPSIGDFEMLPEAWIEYLTNLKPEYEEGVQVETDKPATPTATELRKLDAIKEMLMALPRDGSAGAGWHNTVRDASGWMWRLINSNAYNLTETAGRTLLLALTPTDPQQGGERELLEQWESMRQANVGRFEPIPEESIPPLLPEIVVMNDLPELTSSNRPFLDLITTKPEDHGVGALAERRRLIAREMLAAGRTEQQALTAVWISKAAREMQREQNGLESIWREVEQVSQEVGKRELALSDAPTPVVAAVPVTDSDRPHRQEFLTLAERTYLAEHGSWWGSRYVEWTASRLPRVNLPYSRMNRWTVLALVFSPFAALYKNGRPLFLNLFQMSLGESSTGKTESKDLLREVIRACFPADESPNIGGDLSKESLTKVLIHRDGQPSWLHKDEVDGLFREIQGARGNWNEGLVQRWTDFYEGRVDPIYRQGDTESSGIEATAYLTMHMMGVVTEVVSTIDAALWRSGFMPRFVFAVGEPPVEDLDGDDLNLATEARAAAGDPMPKQWAAEFNVIRDRLAAKPHLPVPMQATPEVNERWRQFTADTKRMTQGHRHESRLKPTRVRFVNSIMKCMALVALSEGETVMTLRHLLIALEQAEEWWANALFMVEATDETPFIRNVNEIERMIAAQPGRRAKLSALNRDSRHDAQTVKRLVDQLAAEDRVLKFEQEELDRSKTEYVQILERIAA